MLVLTRKVGERIVIADDILVEVLEVIGSRVRIGIKAPSGVTILRQELVVDGDQPPRQPRPEARLAANPARSAAVS
jgi:carbon storage regulator